MGAMSDTLGRVLSIIRISDLLDVAIVALLIFTVTKLVHETRAQQLVKGIVILLLATQLCSVLHLDTMTYLLKYAMQFGVLALIIVFQPELRRALEKLGGGTSVIKWFGNEGPSETEEMVDEVAQACATLQRQRIGALIVFERNTILDEVMRTGTDLGDARVTAGLLINIFIPNTPLHDGAVVIKNHKICAATCILPLSENSHLSSELGTRHRAALGLTENSDAVVAVVSEETGKISYAEGGELKRDLSTDELKALLIEALKELEPNIAQNGRFFTGRRGQNE